MKIHTFGDSHSLFGWVGIKDVIPHHLGPLLCYSFGMENLARCDIRGYNVKDGDIVVFCLGEIDCRCHIHKHVHDYNNYQKIITEIINKYMEAIEITIRASGMILKHVCVYNVVPPIEKEKTVHNPQYPFLGSNDDRKKYVLYFNQLLKEKCIEHNFIYFDIYDKYTDPNGFLRKELSDGHVHILDGQYIAKFIDTNLLQD